MELDIYEVLREERKIQKEDPDGRPTLSAHPARFSPDDKYSRHRITIKKRFGILPTQQAKQYIPI
ncbi:hypothetical protein KUTeg_018984 [Tegillarca granosa]|uniref:Nucleolar protein 10 n=1 Tax=Tegillarca granosa TaxID=220873 RepID=A0ABQ9EB80_TEGGR|nr:hypothetical protein KUTeg_018984 [Tegillarca granosa]